MENNKIKKRLVFIFVVVTHWAITILLSIESIKIDLDRKHKVEFSALQEFLATVIKILEDIFSFPLFQMNAFLDSLFFIKGIPGIITVTLVNSIIQVSAFYLLFICLCKCTIKKSSVPGAD